MSLPNVYNCRIMIKNDNLNTTLPRPQNNKHPTKPTQNEAPMYLKHILVHFGRKKETRVSSFEKGL